MFENLALMPSQTKHESKRPTNFRFVELSDLQHHPTLKIDAQIKHEDHVDKDGI